MDFPMRKLPLLLLCMPALFADFSYEQRSQMTGGAMASMMKMAGAFNKKLREPMSTWTHVKGNKIAHVTGTSTMIYDIDAETMTQIDHEKRTYSVVTFTQMREAFASMGSEMKREAPQVDTQIQVDVKETGRKKQLAGTTANEVLMSFIYSAKDRKGQSAEMETQASSWMATNVAGWKEYSEASKRLGLKMANAMGAGNSPFGAGGGMGMQPGMGESWSVLAAKMSKMDGVPLMQIVRMGPKGQLPPSTTMGDPKPAASAQEADSPKASDVLAGALGGRLGGFGRKRKDADKEQMPQKQGEPANAEGGMLMEMTTETLAMSSATVDAAKVSVPSGYQQVESDMLKALNRRRK